MQSLFGFNHSFKNYLLKIATNIVILHKLLIKIIYYFSCSFWFWGIFM